jgi:DNA-binding response OmpR family regulator
MKVLVVEDDLPTRGIVIRALECAGHDVVTAATGVRALELVGSAAPDLVVLDLGLPDLDGFEVCRRIRRDSQVPIVVLTARDEEEDIMRAFSLGADDCLTKPFSARILAARVATILRRAVEAGKRRRDDYVRVGSLELDLLGHEVRYDGREVRLSPLEFRLLHILAANAGRVVPYKRLIEFAWDYEGGTPTRLKIQIHRLRAKLGLPYKGEPSIKATEGTGYVLCGFT